MKTKKKYVQDVHHMLFLNLVFLDLISENYPRILLLESYNMLIISYNMLIISYNMLIIS